MTVEFEEPTGPYECVDCGEEFDSLEDLKAVVTYSDLLFTNAEQTFNETLPLDTDDGNLLVAVRNTIAETAAQMPCINGYYSWKAMDYSKKTARKGMAQVICIAGQDPDVRILENPEPASLQISISALRKKLNCRKVTFDTYLLGTHLVHSVEPVRPIKTDTETISLQLVSVPSETPVAITLTPYGVKECIDPLQVQ